MAGARDCFGRSFGTQSQVSGEENDAANMAFAPSMEMDWLGRARTADHSWRLKADRPWLYGC